MPREFDPHILMNLSALIYRVFPLLILLPLLAFQTPASAQATAQVRDLYRFEVVVKSTRAAERKAGLVNGLEQVMVRVTGDKRIGTYPAAVELFGKVENFVQQYGYSQRRVEPPEEQTQDNATAEMFTGRKAVQMETVLSGRFEPVVLEKALRDAGLPVWDARRPRVLILHAIERGAATVEAETVEVDAVLESAAALRGLPIEMPADANLNARSIWKGDRFAMEDAAQAAGVDYVHWSRIVLEQEASADAEQGIVQNWVVESALYQKGELVREWYFNASSEEVALRRMLDELTDWMADRYAVVSRSGGHSIIGLHVSGVDGVGDYARVLSMLGQQGALEKIELVAIGHQSLVFRVTTRSDPRQLQNNLGLTRLLVAASPSEQHMQAPIWLGELELYYRLQ